MIYRFEILTETDIYEGWAHSPDEMSQKFEKEYPGVDHEVFPNYDKLRPSYPPVNMSLSFYRACLADGMGKYSIDALDQRLGLLT